MGLELEEKRALFPRDSHSKSQQGKQSEGPSLRIGAFRPSNRSLRDRVLPLGGALPTPTRTAPEKHAVTAGPLGKRVRARRAGSFKIKIHRTHSPEIMTSDPSYRGWNVVNQHGIWATIQCPECGTEQMVNKRAPTATEHVECPECGEIAAYDHSTGLALALVAAGIIYVLARKGWGRLWSRLTR